MLPFMLVTSCCPRHQSTQSKASVFFHLKSIIVHEDGPMTGNYYDLGLSKFRSFIIILINTQEKQSNRNLSFTLYWLILTFWSQQSIQQIYPIQLIQILALLSIMSSFMTKYLLLVPASYVAYCIYEDYKLQAQRQEQKKSQQSESIRSLISRFQKCKTTIELANIYKKSLHYLRFNISQPSRQNEQVIDCQVLDSGQNNDVWWISPISTKSLLSLNSYQNVQNTKEGFYSMFFWYNVITKQTLKIKDTNTQIDSITYMKKQRHNKCLEIAQRYEDKANDHFFDCLRKTQAAARFIQKQLQKINIMKSYQNFKN